MHEEGRERPFLLQWRSAVLNSPLTGTQKLCLLVLAEWADADGTNCWPAMDRIAAKASVNEKTVRRSMDEVATLGWFTRSHRRTQKGWKQFEYTLHLPDAADTVSCRTDDAPGTVSGSDQPSTGHFVDLHRTLAPDAPGTVSDDLALDLGKAPRKSSKSKSAHGKTAAVPTAPTWLPAKAWQDWKVYRGKEFSSRAQALAIGKLETLRAEGHDPGKLIDLAIESGWSSFYPRSQTLATQNTPVGAVERDPRSEDELQRANQEQLERFGLGEAA